jgi:aminomethyltransferase
VSEIQHGPLEDRHRQLGASFAEFSGWLMPVSYGGTVGEHTATRTAVGLFDVSHLGKASVRGPGAAEYVNSALTNDLGRIGPGKAQYTLCCTESGGVIDDLIAYYVADDEVFLVPNATNTAAVVGPLFEPDKYGFGLAKGSELTRPLTVAVIAAHESHLLENLGSKYFSDTP